VRPPPVPGAVLIAAASVAIAGCGSTVDHCANGAYAAAVRFHGVVYRGLLLDGGRQVGVGRRIGTGDYPCNPKVAVNALVGVPPAAAVAVVAPGATKTGEVYLAPGFLTALASHPLHAALYGVRRRWTSELRHRCTRPVRLHGLLDPKSSEPRLLVGQKIVMIDGHTRYHGPRRSGLPYLRGGEHVRVRGRACPDTRVMAQVIRARR
jgi:hypothetical protein